MSATLTPVPPTKTAAVPQPRPSDNVDDLVRDQAVADDVVREQMSNTEGVVRQKAIKQIQRRRRFQFDLLVATIVMALVAVIWAITEYNNAGGWPSDGFSQSSSIPYTWNIWIIYPFMAWVLFLALRTWAYFKGTSISEREIQREIERQAGRR